MKTYKKYLPFSLVIALLIPFLVIISSAHAAIPEKINYQGYLADPQGTPIDDTVSIVFSIYSQTSGGMALWTETRSVTLTDGVFSVDLGNTNPINIAFDTPY
ncbi:MAG: hypothetical protein U9R17_04615 [Thermodesulfobacteriota bacterium]|nr:hypothetical protein [Thermodesulfobacteriota bacterium]